MPFLNGVSDEPRKGVLAVISKKSRYSVQITLDRLAAALGEKGIAVAARIDHALAAEKVGEALPPTQLLLFGNPKLGSPLMRSNPCIGLDLPLRVLAWEDTQGQVWVGYAAPQEIAQRYAIGERGAILDKMTALLDGLTTQAAQT